MTQVELDLDRIVFLTNPAGLVISLGSLNGLQMRSLGSKALSIDPNKLPIKITGCFYRLGSYEIPGLGDFEIDKITTDQKVAALVNGEAVTVTGQQAILQGYNFSAVFKVTSPALKRDPTGLSGIPDPLDQYEVLGTFTAKTAAT